MSHYCVRIKSEIFVKTLEKFSALGSEQNWKAILGRGYSITVLESSFCTRSKFSFLTFTKKIWVLLLLLLSNRSQAHSASNFVLFENWLTFGFSSACEGPVLPGDLVPEGGHPEVPLHLGYKEAGGWCRALVVIANLVKPAGGPSRKMLPRL